MMRPLWPLLVLFGCAHPVAMSTADRADAARREGRLPEAYDAYAEALCAEPARLDLARGLVDTWSRLGGAGTPLVRVETCGITEGTRRYVEGLVAGARGDTALADAALARAESLTGDRAEVAYRRGLVALNGAQAEVALGHLERAASLDAARVDIRLALAQCLVDLDRPAEAVAGLRGLLVLAPSGAELERGHQILRRAIQRAEPTLPAGVEPVLLDILRELKEGTPRPETLARAQKLAETVSHTRVLEVAGLVALHRGLEEEARHHLRLAAEANSLDPGPWAVLGESLFAAQRFGEAMKPLAEAWQRDPFDVQVARMLAQASTSVRDTERARDVYRTLTVLEPPVVENFLWLARSERQLGAFERARRAAEHGCRLRPDHIPLLVELASIEAQLALAAPTEAERDAARRRTRVAVDRLLEVAPDHPGAAAILASIERGT